MDTFDVFRKERKKRNLKIPGYVCQLLFTTTMKERKENNTKTQNQSLRHHLNP
jgi:hypothetical protein